MQSGRWDFVSPKTLKEFKEFAVRGNAIDSLVNDILMPPIGKIIGQSELGHKSGYRLGWSGPKVVPSAPL